MSSCCAFQDIFLKAGKAVVVLYSTGKRGDDKITALCMTTCCKLKLRVLLCTLVVISVCNKACSPPSPASLIALNLKGGKTMVCFKWSMCCHSAGWCSWECASSWSRKWQSRDAVAVPGAASQWREWKRLWKRTGELFRNAATDELGAFPIK